MSPLLWTFAGALGVLAVPLALSGATAWLVVPAHGVLSAVACAGALVEAWAHRAERARLWGFAYLVATAAILGALEVGGVLRGQAGWAWMAPFVGVLVWGWLPPVVAGAAGWWAAGRRRRRPVRTG